MNIKNVLFGGRMTKVVEIHDEFTWWLGRKGFVLNNEYRIDLIWIDKVNNSAKIKITNIKTKDSEEVEVNNGL